MAKASSAYLQKAEESLRSAIADLEAGRYNSSARGSYYACFQAAVAALLTEGIKSSARWGHGFVQAQFAGLVVRRKLYSSDLRSVLPQTLKLRQRADYEETPVSARWSRELSGQAGRFVEAVRERMNGDG